MISEPALAVYVLPGAVKTKLKRAAETVEKVKGHVIDACILFKQAVKNYQT